MNKVFTLFEGKKRFVLEPGCPGKFVKNRFKAYDHETQTGELYSTEGTALHADSVIVLAATKKDVKNEIVINPGYQHMHFTDYGMALLFYTEDGNLSVQCFTKRNV